MVKYVTHILKDTVKIIEVWNLSKQCTDNWKSNIWGEIVLKFLSDFKEEKKVQRQKSQEDRWLGIAKTYNYWEIQEKKQK